VINCWKVSFSLDSSLNFVLVHSVLETPNFLQILVEAVAMGTKLQRRRNYNREGTATVTVKVRWWSFGWSATAKDCGWSAATKDCGWSVGAEDSTTVVAAADDCAAAKMAVYVYSLGSDVNLHSIYASDVNLQLTLLRLTWTRREK